MQVLSKRGVEGIGTCDQTAAQKFHVFLFLLKHSRPVRKEGPGTKGTASLSDVGVLLNGLPVVWDRNSEYRKVKLSFIISMTRSNFEERLD